MDTQPPQPDPDKVTFTLTLRPLKSDVPVYVRLRRVLKSLLRTYDFRCVDYSVKQISTPEPKPPHPATPEK